MVVRLLGLLLFAEHVVGLMFQSRAVTSEWDTWAFAENGTYYAYYLITESSPGEGFGVASSVDGQHWIDHGYTFHSPDWAAHHWWEGTGAVWRAADFNTTGRYVINYSQCPGKYQFITFAESYDLIHWTRPAPFNETRFDINTSYYKNPGRWDCIYSIPAPGATKENERDGYPRYGFWTASPKGGTMGFGVTHDGWNWEALPTPEIHPVIEAEVGAVEHVAYGPSKEKSAWYAILGYDHRMVTYSAAHPAGPYVAATKNYVVLTGSCYFARFFRGPAMELLVTHQSDSHQGRTYIAPYKEAAVDDEGVMRMMFWAANEGFKAEAVPTTRSKTTPAYMAHVANVSRGLFVEADVTLPAASAAANVSTWPGFVFEMLGGAGTSVTVVAIGPTGTCAIYTLASPSGEAGIQALAPIAGKDDRDAFARGRGEEAGSSSIGGGDGAASTVTVATRRDHNGTRTANTAAAATGVATSATSVWDRALDLDPESNHAVKILYRRDMLELYLDDVLLPVFLMPAPGSGRVGVLPNPAGSTITNMSAWAMSLPGTPTWPFVPPSPPPPPLPRGDLSPSGKASCSGYFENNKGFACSMGADGVLATRWSSREPYDGSPQWLAVDFGKPTLVQSVRLVWEKAFAAGYSIQASDSTSDPADPATQWHDIYVTSTGKGGTETIVRIGTAGKGATARMVRILCSKRYPGSPYGFSLFEFELFATPTPPPSSY